MIKWLINCILSLSHCSMLFDVFLCFQPCHDNLIIFINIDFDSLQFFKSELKSMADHD